MNPERWQRVEQVYHAVRGRNPRERRLFLDSACRNDSDLRRKVESLLAEDASRTAATDPATFTIAGNQSQDPATLAGGSWLGPYQIEMPLGAGGMGKVYRAHDTRLSRSVAIKVLAAGSVDRFIQEARAASALNHPNIVTIYDVGDTQGVSYIVMELIEGQTLRQIIGGPPLPVTRILAMAAQIADALAAAHSKGIVHRDLKPANIMVSSEGRTKILDFGLAKWGAAEGAGSQITQPGTVLGTCGYMSPEQARGEPIDFRSDQFSLGAVLYEMATGHRAFGGATDVDALAAVIRDQPEPMTRLNPLAPMPLQWLVERCLAKNSVDRYSSTQELAAELVAIAASVDRPSPARAATPHNLPAQRTALVGRDQELENMRQLLLQPHVRLLTLTGPGGIGKTRLAVELATTVLEEFPGGVLFVPLDRVSDAALVSSEIANALNTRPSAERAAISSLDDHVRESCAEPTLLLLDNFEHVMSAAELVTRLLSASGRLKIAVTSRAALRLYGEYEVPVPPLDLPDRKSSPAEVLSKSPAVALFLERATALRAGGPAMDEAQVRIVAEICARLDGLPLAIELAAARTRALPLAALLERVRDPLQLLAGGPRDLPQRQRTLRATLDWSHNLLDPEQQKLFRRMAVFVGGATHEAIEAVCNAQNDLDIDLLDAIESLVDNSLVRRTGADLTEPRFVMLETMREYGRTRLIESGEEAYTRKAHAAYYVVLAEEGEPSVRSPRQQAWWARFDAEIGNIRAAMDWLVAAGGVEWGWRLLTGLQFYWVDRGMTAEAFERMLKLFALPAAARPTKLRGKALITAADMAGFSGNNAERVRFSREGLQLLEELNDPQGMLRALTHGGVSDRSIGDYPVARAQFERAVQIARDLGEPASLAGALSNLAGLVKLQGDFELSRLLQLETSRLFEGLGDQTGVAWSLSHQADLARQQADMEKARSLYEQALSRFRALEDSQGIASCFHDLAALSADAKDYAAAQRHYHESLKRYWDLGNMTDLPRLLESCAACAAGLDAPERALTLAGAAAALRKELALYHTDSAKGKVERTLEAARGRLSSSQASASWLCGWTMRPDEAVRFAVGT